MLAAGVTGAGIAMPLFGAVSAQAAESHQTWDRVAECESGGMWSANGGNGFYGGLQITLDMWKKYGGQQYAPRPDLASRSQQIAIAQAILGDRGPDAWPSCALSAGLADLGDALDGNSGGKGGPESKESKEPTGIDDSKTGESSGNSGQSDNSHESDNSEESDKSDKAGTPDPSATGDGADDGASGGKGGGKSGDSGRATDETSREEGGTPSGADKGAKGDKADEDSSAPTGRHRGAPDAQGGESGDAGDEARPSGRHASRGGEGRAEITLPPLGREDSSVRTDDASSDTADGQGVTGDWARLYQSDKSLIGGNPDLIHPGQRLDLSAK
ncbi:transglycosylase family protein [Streptomyces sp. NPDC097640]|uniref:transglycosylase family protein n=1 Tax=Streptomyces sp. NPDC097640 TaxID=3157229 RepID=UPI00333150D4